MKVLVTGGSGFLGSYLVKELENRSHKVYNFDISKGNDIRNWSNIAKLLKDYKYIYHLAAESDIETDDINKIIDINIKGTANLLEASRIYDAKRFIFASTIYVYGNKGSFYRISKQTCEDLIKEYSKLYGIPYTILRYGSLYGPNANEHNWIYRAIRQAMTENKITRQGNGNEIREYLHIKDAAELSVDMLDNKYENNTYILTGNQTMRIRDLHEMIREILDKDIKLEYKGNNNDSHYDITPYRYVEDTAKKVTKNEYHDLGQGLLECIKKIAGDK